MKMKTEDQVTVIKISYILVLLLAVAYYFGDMQKGFMDGWNEIKPKEELNWLSMIVLLISTCVGIVILTQLYGFINSVKETTVFSEKNIKRIQIIGWNCIIQSGLLYVFYLSKLKYINAEMMRSINFEFWLVLFGLTLLTISFVFKKGLQLQQEQELTI